MIETSLGWKQETLIPGISDQHNGQLRNTLSGIRDMSTLLQQVLILEIYYLYVRGDRWKVNQDTLRRDHGKKTYRVSILSQQIYWDGNYIKLIISWPVHTGVDEQQSICTQPRHVNVQFKRPWYCKLCETVSNTLKLHGDLGPVSI